MVRRTSEVLRWLSKWQWLGDKLHRKPCDLRPLKEWKACCNNFNYKALMRNIACSVHIVPILALRVALSELHGYLQRAREQSHMLCDYCFQPSSSPRRNLKGDPHTTFMLGDVWWLLETCVLQLDSPCHPVRASSPSSLSFSLQENHSHHLWHLCSHFHHHHHHHHHHHVVFG